MTDIVEALQALLLNVRDVSVDQLRIFAKRPGIASAPTPVEELPFQQHMTHILVSGVDIELNFKTHFMLADAIDLTRGKLGIEAVPPFKAIDCLKEFCNLVAGKTKTMLEAAGVAVGQSLPFAIQGYNEIFYPRNEPNTAHLAWRLEERPCVVHCSASVLLRNDRISEQLARAKYSPENVEGIGEVELF